MKKLFILTLLFMLGMVSLAQETDNYVMIDYRTNIRSGPSLEYGIRFTVFTRSKLTVTGKSDFDSSQSCTGSWQSDKNMWLQVDMEGIEGWVAYCVGDFEGNLASLAVVEPTFPSYPVVVKHSVYVDRLGEVPIIPHIIGEVRTKYVHLRSYPSLNGEIIDYLASHEVYVTGISSDGVWVRVQYTGIANSCVEDCNPQIFSGWIAKFLLKYPENWQVIIPVIEI